MGWFNREFRAGAKTLRDENPKSRSGLCCVHLAGGIFSDRGFRPDPLPYPTQLVQSDLTLNLAIFHRLDVRVFDLPHLELKEVDRFETHPEIRNNDIIRKPLDGVEAMSKPLKSLHRPVF